MAFRPHPLLFAGFASLGLVACPSPTLMQRAGALDPGILEAGAAVGVTSELPFVCCRVTPRWELGARLGLGAGFEIGARVWPVIDRNRLDPRFLSRVRFGAKFDGKWAFLDDGPWEASVGFGYGFDRGRDMADIPDWHGDVWTLSALVGRNLEETQLIGGVDLAWAHYKVTHFSAGSSVVIERRRLAPGIMIAMDRAFGEHLHVMTEVGVHYLRPISFFRFGLDELVFHVAMGGRFGWLLW